MRHSTLFALNIFKNWGGLGHPRGLIKGSIKGPIGGPIGGPVGGPVGANDPLFELEKFKMFLYVE